MRVDTEKKVHLYVFVFFLSCGRSVVPVKKILYVKNKVYAHVIPKVHVSLGILDGHNSD